MNPVPKTAVLSFFISKTEPILYRKKLLQCMDYVGSDPVRQGPPGSEGKREKPQIRVGARSPSHTRCGDGMRPGNMASGVRYERSRGIWHILRRVLALASLDGLRGGITVRGVGAQPLRARPRPG